MRITLDLANDVSNALRRFAIDTGMEIDAAAYIAIRECLIITGALELLQDMDENSDTKGNV